MYLQALWSKDNSFQYQLFVTWWNRSVCGILCIHMYVHDTGSTMAMLAHSVATGRLNDRVLSSEPLSISSATGYIVYTSFKFFVGLWDPFQLFWRQLDPSHATSDMGLDMPGSYCMQRIPYNLPCCGTYLAYDGAYICSGTSWILDQTELYMSQSSLSQRIQGHFDLFPPPTIKEYGYF